MLSISYLFNNNTQVYYSQNILFQPEINVYKLPKQVLPSGFKNTPKIAIFRMYYRENGTVTFLETLADNVSRHNYSMMQIYKKMKKMN